MLQIFAKLWLCAWPFFNVLQRIQRKMLPGHCWPGAHCLDGCDTVTPMTRKKATYPKGRGTWGSRAKWGKVLFGQRMTQSLRNGSGVDTRSFACHELTAPTCNSVVKSGTLKTDDLSLNSDSYTYQLHDLEQVIESLHLCCLLCKEG